LVLVVLMVVGCGAADDGLTVHVPPPSVTVTTKTDPLVGNWIASLNLDCSMGVTFTDAGTWSMILGCFPVLGGFEIEAQAGTYTASASRILLTVAKATCSDAAKTGIQDYTVSGDSLSFIDSSGIILFTRNRATGGNGVGTFGCFRMGVFTPSPLAPI
jgi:hypothetical protein